MTELRIHLLGGTHVCWGEGGPALHLSKPSQALFGYLVVHRHRTHSRELLAARLWQDGDDERLRQRFNTALWRLRRQLAPPEQPCCCIAGEPGGTVGFDSECCHWLDVEAFESASTALLGRPPGEPDEDEVEALEAALELYAGELLADCYFDWVLPERRRLETLFTSALEWLIRHARARGRREAAVAAALRLLQCDPLREDIHRVLMSLYAELGQRQRAIRQYDYCRDLLASELDIGPLPVTDALHQAILSGDYGPAASDATPAPARQGEVCEALDQLERARRHLQRAAELLGAPPGPHGSMPASGDKSPARP